MNKLYLAFFYAFCGLLLAICLNLLISTNVWLEMRIHERQVIEICIVLGILFSFFKKNASSYLFFIIQTSMFLLCFWLSKMDLVFYQLRNFYLDGISLLIIKTVFLTILTLFNGLIMVHNIIAYVKNTASVHR